MSPSSRFDYGKLLTRTTAPASLPVTLAEAKAACRVDHVDDDDYITALLNAAVEHLDYKSGVLGIALITQVWTYSVPDPDQVGFYDHIRLPITPVQSIDTITYYDADNVSQSYSTSNVRLVSNEFDAYVKLVEDVDWPSYYTREDAMTITFTAGYGSADDVPAGIKQAIKFLVAHWYDNRSPVELGMNAVEVPMTFDAMIAPFRKALMT